MKKNIFQKEAKKAFLIELKEMEAFARSKHFNVEELCKKIYAVSYTHLTLPTKA